MYKWPLFKLLGLVSKEKEQFLAIMFLHMKLVLLGAVILPSKCHKHETWVGPDGTIQGNCNSIAVPLKLKSKLSRGHKISEHK